MLQVVVFLALAFSIVIAIFAVQNTTPVVVSFLFLRVENVAVSVLVLIAAALGAGVMLLLGTAREVRLRLHQRRLSGRLRVAEQRVSELEASAPAPTTPPAVDSQPSTQTLPLAPPEAPLRTI